MRQTSQVLAIETRGRALYAFTDRVSGWVHQSGIREGLLTLFCRHTSASLLIQENYDPEVQRDLERFLSRLVPEGDPLFEHVIEGPDDMPAHIRAALTQTQLSVPVSGGEMALGTWQGIFLYEHRSERHRREVVLHLIGE